MQITVTNLSTNQIIHIGCAEEYLELLDYSNELESVLTELDENHLDSINYTDDDDNVYLIEKELELLWDWVLTEWIWHDKMILTSKQ